MRTLRAWSLSLLLVGACAIPDIDVVDSLETGGRAATAGTGGSKANPSGGRGGMPDTSTAGEPETGGEPTGGTDTGGTNGAGTSSGGSGGTGPKPKLAYAKFCNAVVAAGESVSFDLRVGEGADLVHLVADSGSCSPAVKRPCVPITTGSEVLIAVHDLDGTQLYPALVKIEPGDAWIFSLYYDELKQDAQLAGKSDISPDECSMLDFADLFGSGS